MGDVDENYNFVFCASELTSIKISSSGKVIFFINVPYLIHRILSEMPQKSGYVFGNGEGGHIGDVKHSFTSAYRKAGIADFRFHDLRHTYASHLAMRGVHIRALQELLGHKTLAQRYSHLAPEQLQNAVKLLDRVICVR